MSKFESLTKPLMWFMALLVAAFMAGCSGSNPVLGGGDINAVPAPPTVTAVAPANIATGVPINTKIVTAAFSKAMTGTTLSTTSFLLECPAGTPVTGTVTYLQAGNVATLTLPASPNLPPTTVCKATVTTAAKDSTGLPMDSNFVWTFTTGATPDTTRPRVALTVPATTPVQTVAANTAITAVFSEDMAPATLASPATSFTLTCAAGTSPGPCVTSSPTGTVSYIPASRIATFALTPAGTVLENGKTYTATIKGTGATPATDLAGNALAGNQAALPAASDYVWTFTVTNPDITPPTITLENPADTANAVAINSSINATFSKAMDLSATVFTVQPSGPPLGTLVPGTWVYDPVSKIATFTPTSPLASGTQYTATITGAKDLAGNALVAGTKPNPWTFTTSVALPPPLAINLGTAASYGIASRAGMTSSGVTVVNGDIALYANPACTDSTGGPGGASALCTGFKVWAKPTGMTVNGSIYYAGGPDDLIAQQVTTDLTTAWNEGKNKVDTFATSFLSGQLAGKTLLPGVYHETVLNLAAGGICQLDAVGDANAVFIIKVDTAFTDSGILINPSQIKLNNGAQAKNVWFIIGGAATIGTGTTWNGNILAGGTLSISGGSTVTGRLLGGAAGAGAFTMTTTPPQTAVTITVP